MTTLSHAPASSRPIPNPKKSLITKLNMGTGIIVGVIFCWGTYYGMKAGRDMTDSHNVNKVLLMSMFAWSVGFLIGIGAFIGPFRWLIGKDLTDEEQLYLAGDGQGISRYFKYCTDHKVVGIQYLVGVMAMLGVGGTMAMMIRTNLAAPGSHFITPVVYNSLVGLHGITMIVAMIIVATGPFGNFIMPIMIGAADMAFPRLNALSWWVLFTAVPVLCSAWFLGGIPTGWTAYAPLSDQAGPGMNAFVATIIIFAVSTAVAGMNITTTVVAMRAKGMKWNRVPIFVIGATISVALAIPAFPTFMVAMIQTAMDRTIATGFYDANIGGSGWLYANLFWIMGHPEVYVILIPGVAALMEIAPVFVRKPLFSYNAAIAGFAGIAGLSVLVWAHHMYIAGWMPSLNGPFMVTTEFISVPTGLLFLVLIGTMWRGRPWMKLPMLCVYAFIWNFLIGGITGIYLSDVPADNYLHGSMFVTAHFHFTLMGAALTGAIGGLAYWFPKMTGRMLNERAGYISFWFVQIGFNVLFLGMFLSGAQGQPRRVADYAHLYAHANMISTAGAYSVGIGMIILLWAIIHSWRSGKIAPMNPWGAKTLEWTVPYPVPLVNFETPPVVTSDPYGYGRSAKQMAHDTEFHVHHDSPEAVGRRERLGVRLLIVADGAFLFGMIFSWFYLRNLNVNQAWLPKGVHSFTTASGWLAASGLIIAAIAHRAGEYNRGVRNITAIIALVALLVGGFYQWHQLANMPFVTHDPDGRPFFNGAYASNWVLVAGANMFHYLIGAFVALGLVLRSYRTKLDPVLEEWRQRTAGSWFTWIAISGVLCAIATSFK